MGLTLDALARSRGPGRSRVLPWAGPCLLCCFPAFTSRAASQFADALADAMVNFDDIKGTQDIRRIFCPNVDYSTTDLKANDDKWVSCFFLRHLRCT